MSGVLSELEEDEEDGDDEESTEEDDDDDDEESGFVEPSEFKTKKSIL